MTRMLLAACVLAFAADAPALLIDNFSVGEFGPRTVGGPSDLPFELIDGLPPDQVLGGARTLNATSPSDGGFSSDVEISGGQLRVAAGDDLFQFRTTYGGDAPFGPFPRDPLRLDLEAVADRFVVRFASSQPDPASFDPEGRNAAALRVAVRTGDPSRSGEPVIAGVDMPLIDSSEPYDVIVPFDDIRATRAAVDFSDVTYVYFSVVGYDTLLGGAFGAVTSWSFAIDEIRAVPEPAVLALAAMALGGITTPRRR